MTRRVGSYVLAGLICAAPAMGRNRYLSSREYQVTAVTESSSGEAGKPDTHSRCLKEEHLANPDAVFNYYALNGFKPNPANKVMNVSMHGGNISYDIEGVYAITAWKARCRHQFFCGSESHPKGRQGAFGHDESRWKANGRVHLQITGRSEGPEPTAFAHV